MTLRSISTGKTVSKKIILKCIKYKIIVEDLERVVSLLQCYPKRSFCSIWIFRIYYSKCIIIYEVKNLIWYHVYTAQAPGWWKIHIHSLKILWNDFSNFEVFLLSLIAFPVFPWNRLISRWPMDSPPQPLQLLAALFSLLICFWAIPLPTRVSLLYHTCQQGLPFAIGFANFQHSLNLRLQIV